MYSATYGQTPSTYPCVRPSFASQTLDETMKLAEKNQSMLAKESERLRKHMEVYGSWWIWMTLLVVSVVYVQMILVIRFIPVME